jgi:cell division protein FtsN
MKRFFFYSFFFLFGSVVFTAAQTDLDSVFKGREYKPVLNPSLRSDSDARQNWVANSGKAEKGDDGYYVLQFDAVADFDAAQRRRAQLSASTGFAIQMVFDTPFYKLRGGGWNSKAKAEDKARELSAYNISAFVVKVK